MVGLSRLSSVDQNSFGNGAGENSSQFGRTPLDDLFCNQNAAVESQQALYGGRWRHLFAGAVNIQGGLCLGLMKKASLLVDHNEADLCRSLGRTVVVVTHDARIFSFADRVLTLNNGQMKPSVHTDSLNAVRMDTNTPELTKKAA